MANAKNQGRLAQDMKREVIGIISQMKDPLFCRAACSPLPGWMLPRIWMRPRSTSA